MLSIVVLIFTECSKGVYRSVLRSKMHHQNSHNATMLLWVSILWILYCFHLDWNFALLFHLHKSIPQQHWNWILRQLKFTKDWFEFVTTALNLIPIRYDISMVVTRSKNKQLSDGHCSFLTFAEVSVWKTASSCAPAGQVSYKVHDDRAQRGVLTSYLISVS